VSHVGATLLWHDFETFGANSEHDFPSQFAAIRTDHNFNVIGSPTNILCRAPLDYLPSPFACLVTGMTPFSTAHGLSEPEFAARVHFELAAGNTTSVGYNSMRFDEEFTRQLLWRNFYPPYAREYQHGNARFDVIDVMRMAYALRPQGMHWPSVDGKPSFKLGELTAANGLTHDKAHDALNDVQALIALSKKLRDAQPKLWDYAFSLRRKALVQSFINYQSPEPLVHISQRFGAERGCLALWLPICAHPSRSNEIIGIDLAGEIESWIELSADEICERVFVRQADLPEDTTRVLIKTLHLNRTPMIAQLSVLKGADLRRLQLHAASDHPLELQLERAKILRANASLSARLQSMLAKKNLQLATDLHANSSLYSGFVGPGDSALCEKIRAAKSDLLALIGERLTDVRLKELLWRYRARHFPEVLSSEETQRWRAQALNRLQFENLMTFERFDAELALAKTQASSPADQTVLHDLHRYAELTSARFKDESAA
jgi:exodeoxyribonuclease I